MLKRFGLHCLDCLRAAWSFQRRHMTRHLVALGIGLALSAALFPFDKQLLPLFQFSDNPLAHELAGAISTAGKFEYMTLGWVLAAWGCGWLCRRADWKRLGTAILIASIVASVLANIGRAGFGRARPYSEDAGKFTGPVVTHEYNGFPSAHTVNAFAAATVIAIAYPAAGVPSMIYAGSVGWSRMQRDRHFPADVLFGTVLGVVVAVGYGRWVRPESTGSSKGSTQPSSTN